jgi:hypothetical protein
MRRVLSAAVALAILATPSWAGLASHSWAGTLTAKDHGSYMLLGDVATGKGDLGIPTATEPMTLVTTSSGWSLTGSTFGSLSGVFGTLVPGKVYTGAVATSDIDAWVQNRLAAQYAAVTNVSAIGVASFRPSKDGSSVKVIVIVGYTAQLSGTYLAGGEVKVTGKLLLP